MAHELARVEANMAALDEISKELSIVSSDIGKSFKDSLKMALATQRVADLLTDEVLTVAIVPLKNKSFGFLTDEEQRIRKGHGPYPLSTIRDVMVEAVMRGVRPTGNELNIISSRLYVAKNGVKRKVKEFAGLTDLVIKFSVPKMVQGGALVEAEASFKLNGETRNFDRKGNNAIPIRVNEGQGADAVLGKAERKMRAYIYETLTGSDQSVGDVDELDESTLKQANAVEVDVDLSKEAAPVSRADEVKAALNKQAVEKAKAANAVGAKKGNTVTPPPVQAAAPAPVSAAAKDIENLPVVPEKTASKPAPAAPKPDDAALMAKAKETLAFAKDQKIKVSVMDPILKDGKIHHPNLNPDGTYKGPVKEGAPTNGETVKPNAPAPTAFENGKPVAAKEPAAAAETEVTGEVDTLTVVIVNTQKKAVPPDGKTLYTIKDEHANQYATWDKKMAVDAREFQEKKERVVVEFIQKCEMYAKHGKWELLSIKKAPPEEAAPATEESQDEPWPSNDELEVPPTEGAAVEQEM